MAISIPRDRLEVRTSRSRGPGGQGVNTTESKVEIRFVLADADWIPLAARARLAELFPSRLNNDGEFVLASDRSRSQSQNLEDCLAKLGEMIQAALIPPKIRRKTKPTRGSKERRLEGKRRQSDRKRSRSGGWGD